MCLTVFLGVIIKKSNTVNKIIVNSHKSISILKVSIFPPTPKNIPSTTGLKVNINGLDVDMDLLLSKDVYGY